jgi:predicted lipoprotein with Yx(FWY)xxD motif
MTSSSVIRTLGARGRIAVPLIGVGLLAAACASSGGTSTSAAAAPAGSSAPAAASPAASAAGSSAGGAVTVETHMGPLGTYLTDSAGDTLYMFASDTATSSSCSSACASAWPPLTSASTPTAGSGVTGALTTIMRSDGSMQVAYAGHPLYTFKGDGSPGATTGQGSDAFGAKWWVLSPSGKPIEGSGGAAAPSASPSASKSSGGSAWS